MSDQFMLQQVHFPRKVQNAVAELYGIAGSIIYDRKVDDVEISFLNEWIGMNQHLCVDWPLTDLCKLLDDIQSDGVVSDKERQQVYEFLIGFGKLTKKKQPPENIFAVNPTIVFCSKNFVLTGEMQWGERQQAVEAIYERNGHCMNSFSGKTHYLVVGSRGSEFWKEKGYGTKVMKAVEYIRDGRSQGVIVHEDDFVKAVMEPPRGVIPNSQFDIRNS